MTKQEAIENHRKLWNWIANTSEKENRCVRKGEYFSCFNLKMIKNDCYCCEYTGNDCCLWPIKWLGTGKTCDLQCIDSSNISKDWNKSEYGLWENTVDVQECIRLARIIANLPENPDVE